MMSLDFFPCTKIPIPYDALYVYDACNVLVKSYSKSVVATTHGIVLAWLLTSSSGPISWPIGLLPLKSIHPLWKILEKLTTEGCEFLNALTSV